MQINNTDNITIIPTTDIRVNFMRDVYNWAARSKDPRTKIGAVIVQGDQPLSNGFNNFARGVKDFAHRYEKPLKYDFMKHAESNAVINAARHGRATLGATIYTQGIPCKNCADDIINAGIKKVIVHKQWPNLTYSPDWVESIALATTKFGEAGVEIEWLDFVLNLEGFLDGKIIKV